VAEKEAGVKLNLKQKAGPTATAFFVDVLRSLRESGTPFLVGGGYALRRHTPFDRPVNDLDLFLLPAAAEPVLRFFADLGYRTELTFPHWLGKIYKGKAYVDIIFSSGNSVSIVDDLWFRYAVEDEVLGETVRLCPPEEMIWSKAFIMDRDRFDGADVIHLLLGRGEELDWPRLLERFRPHPLVLLSHLVLLQFAYPSARDRVPAWVWSRLLKALETERRKSNGDAEVCRGTLLSRGEYLEALRRGYRDARVPPDGIMRPEDVERWTQAARDEGKVL
jgi:hypothetical protein